MEASAGLGLKSSLWTGPERGGGQLGLQRGWRDEKRVQAVGFRDSRRSDGGLNWSGRAHNRDRAVELKVSCCRAKNTRAPGSQNFQGSADEALILKSKADDVGPYLNGRCIYLVGMMGSGKTTVGKILSEVLGYSFFDSDKLVEQAVGISSVAQIFKEHSEAFFRDSESKVLRDLSSMSRLVVATGGGAVIRPINWRYMKHGLTIWLDVPLEALARRISAVGTNSRPLLHEGSGDPYTKAFVRLTTLSEQRGKAYANADARVSLEDMAAKKGHGDATALTPTDIAIEALIRIEYFLTEKKSAVGSSYLQG